jgi:hypothetical protein
MTKNISRIVMLALLLILGVGIVVSSQTLHQYARGEIRSHYLPYQQRHPDQLDALLESARPIRRRSSPPPIRRKTDLVKKKIIPRQPRQDRGSDCQKIDSPAASTIEGLSGV